MRSSPTKISAQNATADSFYVTGAVIAGNTMVSATLAYHQGSLEIQHHLWAEWDLESSHQEEVWRVLGLIKSWAHHYDISQVVLRQAGPLGAVLADTCAGARLETLLQVVTGCATVLEQDVARWLTTTSMRIPSAVSEPPSLEEERERMAIEAAAFGVARILEEAQSARL